MATFPLLIQGDARFAVLPAVMIAVAFAETLVGRILELKFLVVGAGVLLAVLGAFFVHWLHAGPFVMGLACVFPIIFLILGYRCEHRLALASAAALPLTILAAALLSGGSGRHLALQALAWTLCAWPILALLHSPESWRMAWTWGIVPIMLIAVLRLLALDADLKILSVAVTHIAAVADPLFLCTQALILLAGIVPMLARSESHWTRWLTLSVIFVAATVAALTVTGPWPKWPQAAIISLIVSGSIVGLSLIGAMSTLRRLDLIDAAAAKCLGLGTASSAVLVMVADGPQRIASILAGLLPVLVGSAFALVCYLASVFVRKLGRADSTHRTALERYPRTLTGMTYLIQAEIGRRVLMIRKDARRWFAPRGIVPVILFAACLPVLGLMDTEVFIVVSVFPAMLIAGMFLERPFLVLLIGAGLAATAAWAAGGNEIAIIATIGLVLGASITHSGGYLGWIYPYGIVLAAPLWCLLDDAKNPVAVLAVGCAVLLSNCLRSDYLRRTVLSALAVISLVITLFLWARFHDRYLCIAFGELNLGTLLAAVLEHMPPILLLLGLLLAGRAANPSLAKRWWLILLCACVGALVAVVWSLGIRLEGKASLILWIGLLGLAGPLCAILGTSGRNEWRLTIFDGLSLLLVNFLIAGAELIRQAAHKDAGAGNIGLPLVQSSVDALSIVGATAIILGLRLIQPSIARFWEWSTRQWHQLVG